jgi:hypothetical protein
VIGIAYTRKPKRVRVFNCADDCGHKHLSTTQRYIDVNESKLRGAIELI